MRLLTSLACCLLTFAPLLAQQNNDPLHAKHLASEKALAKQAGLPIAPEDLSMPPFPPSQNALVHVKQFLSALQTKPLKPEELRFLNGDTLTSDKPTATVIASAEAVLRSRTDITNIVDKAVSSAFYDRGRDWLKGFPLFRENGAQRNIARWIAATTRLLLAKGRYVEAVKHQAKGMQWARLSEELHPSTLSLLAAYPTHSLQADGMRELLLKFGEKPGVAATAAESVAHIAPPSSFAKAVPAETASNILLLNSMRQACLKGDAPKKQAEGFGRKLDWGKHGYPSEPNLITERLFNANEANYIRLQRSQYHADAPPPSEKEVEQRSGNPDFVFADALATSMASYQPLYVRMVANYRIIEASARVLAWKEAHGGFPDALKNAVPKELIDPFSKKPLLYRKTANGFVVYSAGGEGKASGRYNPRDERAGVAFWFPSPALKP